MDAQLVRFAFQGPLGRAEFPDRILYDARMRFAHDAPDAATAIADALRSLGGTPRVRRILLLGACIDWVHGPYDVQVRIRGGRFCVMSRHRLRPSPLDRLVQALAAVPGARDLEVEANVRHFSPALANLRACTPCQARQF